MITLSTNVVEPDVFMATIQPSSDKKDHIGMFPTLRAGEIRVARPPPMPKGVGVRPKAPVKKAPLVKVNLD